MSQPKIVTTAEMDKAILNNNNGITVLMVTEKEHFNFMKSIMKKVYIKFGNFTSPSRYSP